MQTQHPNDANGSILLLYFFSRKCFCEIIVIPAQAATTTRCNPLRHTAIRRYMLQYTAPRCNTLQHTDTDCNSASLHIATLQHCNKLQQTAINCNKLQHTATPCNLLQQKYLSSLRGQPLHAQRASRLVYFLLLPIKHAVFLSAL